MKIEWAKKGLESLNVLEKEVSKKIVKKINELKENFRYFNIKRLEGSDLFRIRVGDYRVIFEIWNNIIYILKVGHRKNIYKR
ncbi:MAG: type II toxin-antitoxin system RelE/ParE family toxin [archaeon]